MDISGNRFTVMCLLGTLVPVPVSLSTAGPLLEGHVRVTDIFDAQEYEERNRPSPHQR